MRAMPSDEIDCRAQGPLNLALFSKPCTTVTDRGNVREPPTRSGPLPSHPTVEIGFPDREPFPPQQVVCGGRVEVKIGLRER